MEVKLDKRYPVAAGIEQCWAVLGDVRAVAACMPGAQITEQIDDTHFKGTVKSKVGPAVMSFNGDIELQGRDEAGKSLSLLGKGADKAGSSASMQLTAHLENAAEGSDGSVLVGVATIVVSGKLAQFGSRLLVPVSDAMLAQFADNFRSAATAARGAGAAASAASADNEAGNGTGKGATPTDAPADPANTAARPAAEAPPPAPASAAASAAHATRSSSSGAASSQPSSGASTPSALQPGAHAAAAGTANAPRPPAAPAPVKELNALALMWTVLKGLLAGVFRRKP